MLSASLLSYVVILLVASFLVKKKVSRGSEQFAMAGRQIGSFSIFSSVFTLIGAGEFLTVASLAFINDGAAITLLTGYGLGMLILGLGARYLRKDNEGKFYYSLPDMIYDKFGRIAGLIASLLTISAFFALLVLQLFAGSIVISEITPLSAVLSTFLCSLIIIVYLLISGFRGVIVTDKIQFFLMLTGLPLLAFVSLPSLSGVGQILELEFGLVSTVSVLSTGVFVVLGSGDIWQRIYAAKSDRAIRIGMSGAGLGFILYSVVLALIGIAAREAGLTDDPDAAFLSLVLANENAVLSSLIAVAIFSAILSTADTETFLISALLANEWRRWKGGYNDNLQGEVSSSVIKYIIPAIAIMGAISSIFANTLVGIYEFLLLLLLAISPLVVLLPFREFSPFSASITLFIGSLSLMLVALLPFLSLNWAVCVVLPGLVYGLFVTRPRKDKNEKQEKITPKDDGVKQ